MMRRVSWKLLPILVLTVLSAGCLGGSGPQAGTVTGVVENLSGLRVSGAVVAIDGSRMVPAAAGTFSAASVAGGSHVLRVQASGYRQGESTIRVDGDTHTTVRLSPLGASDPAADMQIAPGQAQVRKGGSFDVRLYVQAPDQVVGVSGKIKYDTARVTYAGTGSAGNLLGPDVLTFIHPYKDSSGSYIAFAVSRKGEGASGVSTADVLLTLPFRADAAGDGWWILEDLAVVRVDGYRVEADYSSGGGSLRINP